MAEPILELSTRAHEMAFIFWLGMSGSGLLPGAAIVLQGAGGAPAVIGSVGSDGSFTGERLGYCHELPLTLSSVGAEGAPVSAGIEHANGCG